MCAKSPLLVVSDYEVRQVAWETLVSAAGSQTTRRLNDSTISTLAMNSTEVQNPLHKLDVFGSVLA